ncbi:MAG: hypothetical protein ABI895_16305 [Deltaproteobacteria bacterium]
MTAAGVLLIIVGASLSVALALWLRSSFCVVLFFYHLGASVFYWQYSLTNVADAQGYYYYTSYASEFDLGSNFVQWLTAFFRDFFQASYLDLYMLYHLFGYAGLVILFHLGRNAFRAQQPEETRHSPLLYAVCLLPGLNFWTSSIGKDGLVFLGVMCIMWSVVDATRRFPALILGLCIVTMIRPHVGALLAATCALSAALSSDMPVFWRILIFATLAASVIGFLPYLARFVGVETLDQVGVENGIGVRQANNLEGGSSVDIRSYPLPLQVFTYLYRPLFDVRGILSVIESLMNIFLLSISVLLAPSIPRVLRAGPQAFYLRFNFFFFVAATLVLATTTANLGIASRQKTMVLPCFLLLLLTGLATRRAAHAPSDAEATGDTDPPTEVNAPIPESVGMEPRELGARS